MTTVPFEPAANRFASEETLTLHTTLFCVRQSEFTNLKEITDVLVVNERMSQRDVHYPRNVRIEHSQPIFALFYEFKWDREWVELRLFCF
jgi:hypothetical protein